MTTMHIAAAAVAAVLLFWVVGAYNRMVALRNALVAGFAPVDQRFAERQALLDKQIEALGVALASAAPRLDMLRAAVRQAGSAREHARAHPGALGAITSLRLAEEILADARARLPAASLGTEELPDLQARLAASDTTLDFARREFNAGVLQYNRAVAQFPTGLLAALFGFRPAGTL